MRINRAFSKASLWWRLCRFDKPVGIVLLWVPTACALWLANKGNPAWSLVTIFFVGTVLMRAAGCIVNDLADRDFDAHVERTRVRPLASGELSVWDALIVLCLLLSGAASLLWFLPAVCLVYAMVAIAVTVIYPFCKRWIHAPQSILGIAFSMGIPMAYAASHASFDTAFWLLFCLNYLWIIAYDTEYAMVDRDDDQQIGIRSTAIWFAHWDFSIVTSLLVLQHVFWLAIGLKIGLNISFVLVWALGWLAITYQSTLVQTRQRNKCLQAFMSNSWYGLWMWLGIGLL